MFVSVGNSRMDKKFNGQEMTYEEFAKRLSQTVYTAETMEQYRKMPKGEQDNVKDVGGFVLGKLKGGRRKKDCVISRSAVTLDMDYGTEGILDEIEMFFDMKMIAYSTHKHTPEKPRLRLIIFLAREVTPDEYGAVSRMLADDIGIELFDDSTYEPSRLMYWPSTSSDGEYVFREMDGRLVEPDEVLARYRDWHDVSSWPVSHRQSAVVRKDVKQQADPLSKEGLIGAFNRTYSITDAIDKFLPDVYRPSSAIHGRYDYIPADSAAGVVIYDGLFAYSHHATDPCCGKLMNAFDVVRLHKFGEKDARAAEGTEAGKLPSFKAMQEFAAQDEQVKATLARERQELAAAEFSETEEDWQSRLVIDRRGNIRDSLQNIALSSAMIRISKMWYTTNLRIPLTSLEICRGSRSSRDGTILTLPMRRCILRGYTGSGPRRNSRMPCLQWCLPTGCTIPSKNIFPHWSGTARSVSIPCSLIISARRIRRIRGRSSARRLSQR